MIFCIMAQYARSTIFIKIGALLTSNLDKDVLLYYGKFDNMVPLKNMESLDKLLPSSQLFIDDRAGHHPMEDSPETVSKEVLAFLKS